MRRREARRAYNDVLRVEQVRSVMCDPIAEDGGRPKVTPLCDPFKGRMHASICMAHLVIVLLRSLELAGLAVYCSRLTPLTLAWPTAAQCAAWLPVP